MKALLPLLLAALLMSACAPSVQRVGYTPPPGEPADCPVKILKNQQGLDESKRIGQIIVYDKGFATGCSEPEIVTLLTREACLISANVVNLYNITEPSVFGSTCFQTYADFFKMDDPSAPLSASSEASLPQGAAGPGPGGNPPQDSASIPKNRGFQIRVGGNFGPVLSGGQLDLAKQGLNPSPDGVSRSGFEVGLLHWWDLFGLEADFNMSASDANKTGVKPFAMYHLTIYRAGAAVAPLFKVTRKGQHRVSIHGGVNYCNLKFDKGMGSSLPEANGIGFYGVVNHEFIYPGGILFGWGIGFEAKNPETSGNTGVVVLSSSRMFDLISSNELFFPIYLGYKF